MSAAEALAPEQSASEVRESLSVTEKGQPANTIGNCRTVFCHDPLLRGAIRLNLLTDRVDIVRDLGWRRNTSALTDTDVKYLLLYFEQNYGLTSEKKMTAALSIVANENCYGYRKSADGRMEPNPETAAVVQLIFQLAATGIGAAAITRELFKQGIPTPGEYKAAHGQQFHDVSRTRGRWSSSTVLRILEDERYIGSYVIGRRAVIEVGGTRSRRKDRDKWFIIPNHHPAIVDKELFEKVQAVQRRFSLPTRKTREYPLKGKIYCGCCDHALSRIAQKRPFYMCRHSTADVNSRCRDVRADAAGLEEAVLLTLKKQLEILLPVHEDGTIHLEATAAKCSEYEKQLEALKDQKQALFERYLLGQIELDTYKSEKAVYDPEILKVKNAYAAVTAQEKLKREEQARQSSRQEIVHSIAAADVLTSELTNLLIEKVYVFPDNRIEIVYKIHDLFE